METIDASQKPDAIVTQGDDLRFQPPTVTVSLGRQVRWTNMGSTPPAEFRAAATVNASRFPAWAQIVSHLGADDFDARFEHGLDLILGVSAQHPGRVRARRRQARPRPPSR